jgi:hypothetical protein
MHFIWKCLVIVLTILTTLYKFIHSVHWGWAIAIIGGLVLTAAGSNITGSSYVIARWWARPGVIVERLGWTEGTATTAMEGCLGHLMQLVGVVFLGIGLIVAVNVVLYEIPIRRDVPVRHERTRCCTRTVPPILNPAFRTP